MAPARRIPKPKRERQPNWTEAEKDTLLALTREYPVVLDTKGSDTMTNKRKADAWDKIAEKMYAAGYQRNKERLKQQLGRIRSAENKRLRDGLESSDCSDSRETIQNETVQTRTRIVRNPFENSDYVNMPPDSVETIHVECDFELTEDEGAANENREINASTPIGDDNNEESIAANAATVDGTIVSSTSEEAKKSVNNVRKRAATGGPTYPFLAGIENDYLSPNKEEEELKLEGNELDDGENYHTPIRKKAKSTTDATYALPMMGHYSPSSTSSSYKRDEIDDNFDNGKYGKNKDILKEFDEFLRFREMAARQTRIDDVKKDYMQEFYAVRTDVERERLLFLRNCNSMSNAFLQHELMKKKLEIKNLRKSLSLSYEKENRDDDNNNDVATI